MSGIIGVPAGYVGHDQGGRLINDLNSDPYGVFLLDEADKAHPDVMQPFLNLFDEGWILDQRGTKAYADRAIFILTTNVGQRQIAELCKSGKSILEITATMKESPLKDPPYKIESTGVQSRVPCPCQARGRVPFFGSNCNAWHL